MTDDTCPSGPGRRRDILTLATETFLTHGYAGALQRPKDIRADPTLTDAARIRDAMLEIYRMNLTTPVGRMAPMIAEVAPSIPGIAHA